MKEIDPVILKEYRDLEIDEDVRLAWADHTLMGSHHETVMFVRNRIMSGEYDQYPAIQAMQLLKNRLKNG